MIVISDDDDIYIYIQNIAVTCARFRAERRRAEFGFNGELLASFTAN